MHERTYLDSNATSILRPCVRNSMAKAFDLVGNPSSVHYFGRAARYHIDLAREQVASLVGVLPSQVIFTSGGTESNNLAINGINSQITITSSIEHASILKACLSGYFLPVDNNGVVNINRLPGLVPKNSDKTLVSIMLANNETGVIQPIKETAEIGDSLGAIIHTDAVQAAGKIPIDFAALNVHCMSISAHKLGGPAGVGALIIKEGLDLSSLLVGGGQENSYRPGTQNTLGIIGFGAAAEAARTEISEFEKLSNLRNNLELRIKAIAPVKVFGSGAERLPNTSLLGFPNISSETLVLALDLEGIAVSSGAACSSGKVDGNHVLSAMGAKEEAIRVSFGWSNNEEDIDAFMRAFEKIYPRLVNGLAA